jgi:hypothetical protein
VKIAIHFNNCVTHPLSKRLTFALLKDYFNLKLKKMEKKKLNDQENNSPVPGPEQKLLNIIIGKWITVGKTVANEKSPTVPINASDVYEWVPGGFYILHSAFGVIGGIKGGAVEMIGYDSKNEKYFSHNYDSQGNATLDELTITDNVWMWTGKKNRCKGIFSNDGQTLTAHHEMTTDGKKWVPSMEVLLHKAH